MGWKQWHGPQRGSAWREVICGALIAVTSSACGESEADSKNRGSDPRDASDAGHSEGGRGADAGEEDAGLASDHASYAVSDFGYVEARAEGFQPLTRRSYRAVRSEELLVLQPDQARANAGFAIDDRVQDRGEFATLPTSLEGQVYDLVRGDVDADGNDEALLVRLASDGSVTLTLAELKGDALEERVLGTLTGPAKTYVRITAGDLDGDLRDELVVASLDGAGMLHLDVFDDALGFKRLAGLEFESTKLFDVSRGDFDGDGIDEFVVLREDTSKSVQALFYALDGATLVPRGVLEGASLALNSDEYQNRRLQVVAGDLDDDGRDEPVFGTIRHNTNGGFTNLLLVAHDDGQSSHVFLEEIGAGTEIDNWPLDHRIGWHLAVADTNGDQHVEVVSLIPSIDQSAGSQRRYYLHHFSFLNAALADQKFSNKLQIVTVTDDETVHQETGAWLTVLDDERSGRDTVAVSVLDASPGDSPGARKLELSRFRAQYQSDAWNLLRVERETFPIVTPSAQNESWVNPVMLGLDLDADNLKLEYTGEKWLSLPEPFVLLVMAAPPVQHDLDQNIDDSATAYGHQASQGTSASEEIGTTVGATVSFETPSIASIFSYQASASIERELTKTQTHSQIKTFGTSFSGSGLHDYVIFQGTLYTSYKYKVVAAADPLAIGTFMTIDEPVSTKIYKWTLDYFNATITNSEHHVDRELFVHRPGEVASYGSADRKSGLLSRYDGWQSNPVVTVGQGEGTNQTSISLAEESTNTTNLNITKSISAGASVAGLGFEGSFSLHEGQELSISVGEEVSYEGTVGDIASASEYRDHGYSFGMFVYNWTAPDATRSFQVIDYWVDSLGPGFSGE